MSAQATTAAHLVRALVCGLGTLLLMAGAARAQAVEAEVTLQPDPVALEEFALLEIAIEGADTQGLYFDASFDLDNFARLGAPSQSTRISIVNGVPSTRRTLTWRLSPQALGAARVRAIVVEVGDRRLTLDDRAIEVVEEAPSGRLARRRFGQRTDPLTDLMAQDPFERLFGERRRRARRAEAPKVFLRAEASPRRPHVGQQVLWTLYLFTQVDIHSVNPEAMPDFQGFWVREIPQPGQMEPEMVREDGETYGRVVLLQRALFPRRAGAFTLEPTRAQMIASLPQQSPFGALLGRSTEIQRVSNAIELSVRDLPEDPPDDFQGAVGKLALTATLEPAALAVGEAATLTLTLQGAGHLQGLAAPALPELPGVRIFPPQQESAESLRGTRVRGKRVWRYVLVPQRPGQWTLDALAVPYFDPSKGAYRRAEAPPLALQAEGAMAPAATAGLDGATSPDAPALHGIRSAALPATRPLGFDAVAPWLLGLPMLIGLVALGVQRRTAVARQPRRVLLAALDAARSEPRPRQVAAGIEDAWRSFLHERWDIPTGTPSPQWADRLIAQGAPRAAAEQLVALADDLHYLRYAPKLSSTDRLREELIDRSRRLARSLR
ncbi:MAG: BatD family protein [Acidobacteriota bacterium]